MSDTSSSSRPGRRSRTLTYIVVAAAILAILYYAVGTFRLAEEPKATSSQPAVEDTAEPVKAEAEPTVEDAATEAAVEAAEPAVGASGEAVEQAVESLEQPAATPEPEPEPATSSQ